MSIAINQKRRSLLLSTPIALAIAGCQTWVGVDRPVRINLSIQNELGHPVPHAFIWAYVLPRSSPLAPDSQALRRIALRYTDSAEFATPFNRIVPGLLVLPMADANGHLDYILDYKWLEGGGAHRPRALSFGFAGIKRGYAPGFIDFHVTDQGYVKGKIVLVRDLNQAINPASYEQTFGRLCFEISDPRRFERISEYEYLRMERLRAALQVTAEEALNAGDRPTAARIFARMQHLPAIRLIDGKPAGFSQADPYAAQSWSYLLQAFELDPQNPYIATEKLFREGAVRFGGRSYDPLTATTSSQQAFETFLSQLKRLMNNHRRSIWPTYHELYALWFRKANDPRERENVRPLLEQLYREEPNFQTREELMRILQ